MEDRTWLSELKVDCKKVVPLFQGIADSTDCSIPF
jgi:hypothetical protein